MNPRVLRRPSRTFMAGILASALSLGFLSLPTPAIAADSADSAAVTNTSAGTQTDFSQPTSITLKLSKLGDIGSEQSRTRQYYYFDNIDYTGLYIRPGIKAQFKVTVQGAQGSTVQLTRRQAGQVDTSSGEGYQKAGTIGKGQDLKQGTQTVTIDTTANQVGQFLLLRNKSTQDVTVTIENMKPLETTAAAESITHSLGTHLYYVHDEAHPEKFWDYLQQLRVYAQNADTKLGDLVGSMNTHMNATGLLLGRSMFDMRATKLVDLTKNITTQQEAIDYIVKANKVNKDRLEFFDTLQGFDPADPNELHHPSKQRVVVEFTSNITKPSTMYAWSNYYHMPEGDIAGILDGTNIYSWGNTHEYGHMLDVNTLAIPEETNNLFSLAGRRKVAEQLPEGSNEQQYIALFHQNAKRATDTYEQWLADKLAGKNPQSKWGDIWYDVVKRYDVGQFFNTYDYSDYDFAANTAYSKGKADTVKKYGTLGAVYRLIREDGALKNSLYNDTTAPEGNTRKFNAMVRVYSDATGFNMADVFVRLGMPENLITDSTKQFAQQYPELSQPIEYFTLRSDLQDLANAPLLSGENAHAKLEAYISTKSDNGTYRVSASLADSALRNTVTAYELREDGKPIAYSRIGLFQNVRVAPGKDYTVVAYDRRLNSVSAALDNPETPTPAPNTPEPETPAPDITEHAPDAPEPNTAETPQKDEIHSNISGNSENTHSSSSKITSESSNAGKPADTNSHSAHSKPAVLSETGFNAGNSSLLFLAAFLLLSVGTAAIYLRRRS